MARFVKGQSGNPSGRRKIPPDVREAARALTPEALEVQASIMRDGEAPAAVRIAAAENIINRAYGRPVDTTNLTVNAGAAFVDVLKAIAALSAPPPIPEQPEAAKPAVH